MPIGEKMLVGKRRINFPMEPYGWLDCYGPFKMELVHC